MASSILETGEKVAVLVQPVVFLGNDESNHPNESGELAEVARDTEDEDLLREMWKQCEDPEEKRLLRTRMYKLREDRLQHFYGRDGQEILDSILKPEFNTSGDIDSETRSMHTSSSGMIMTTTSSEIQSGDEIEDGQNQNQTIITGITKKSAITTASIQLNQDYGITKTNVVASSTSSKKLVKSNLSSCDGNIIKQQEKDQELIQLKKRILSKDRSSQVKEIEEQMTKQGSGGSNFLISRRKSSTGDSETNTKTIGNVCPKQGTITTNNNKKVRRLVLNNARNGMDVNETEREKTGKSSGRISRRGDETPTITSGKKSNIIVNGRSSSAVSTRMGSEGSGDSWSLTRLDGRRVDGNRASETTTITKTSSTRSTKSSTMMTMKNSTVSTTTTTTGRISSVSSASSRKVDRIESPNSTTTAISTKKSNNKFVDRQSERSTKSRSSLTTNESIPLGSVRIEELVETPSSRCDAKMKLSTATILGSGTNKRKSKTESSNNSPNNIGARGRDQGKPGYKADGEPINRNLNRTSSGGQLTKSEKTNKTTSASERKTCSKGSTTISNATATLSIHGSNRAGSGATTTIGGQDKGNKVVNKSRESSPKRSGSPSPISKGNTAGGKGGSKATLKTGESLQTPVIKVDRDEEEEKSGGNGTGGVGSSTTKNLFKKDNNKTEESIIRELDGILDNYLYQRSISIDEASVGGESGKMNGAAKSSRATNPTTTTTMELDHKKVLAGGDSNVDVLEAGIEPPFTKTEYKYNCPGEENRHHHRHEDHGFSSVRNTNETRELQSAPNPHQDTNLNSNIEDQIIVDLDETGLVSTTRIGKSEARQKATTTITPTSKVNLSTNSTNRSAPTSKSNVKKSCPDTDKVQSDRKVGSNIASSPTFTSKQTRLQSSNSNTEQRKRKEENYTADILSRSSISEEKKTKIATNTIGGSKRVSSISTKEDKKVLPKKPEPNPRAKKLHDDYDDKSLESEGGWATGDYGLLINVTSKIGSARELKNDNDNDDGDDNPLKPQTIKHPTDHPGVVLKAKSLFETKAQEAALDRTSADFDMDKGITQSAKVSKKAAIFEARSRGERISVSSESSVANSATEEKGSSVVPKEILSTTSTNGVPSFPNKNLENSKKVSATSTTLITTSTVPTLKREKSSLTTISKQKVDINKQDVTTTSADTTTTRSTSRKSSPESHSYLRRKSSEVKFDVNENVDGEKISQTSVKCKRYNQRRESGKSETDEESPSRQQQIQMQKRRKSSSEQGRKEESQRKKENSISTTTTTTRRRASEDKTTFSTSPPPASATVRNKDEKLNERRRSSTSSQRKNSLPEQTSTNTKKPTGVKSDKWEHDETQRVQSTTTLTSTSISTSTQNSNRMTTSELNAVDGMEDIEELSRLLDKATDYDERSKIRARIRGLKRKAALVKKSSASENSEVEGETFTTSSNYRVSESVNVNIMNAKNKAISAVGTTILTNGANNKASHERRRLSGEISPNKVTQRKKSEELAGRRVSGAGVEETENNIKNEIKRRSSKTGNTETTVSKVVDDVLEGKSSFAVTDNTTPLKSETTFTEVSRKDSVATFSVEESTRRLSADTQQLLSTRKYSRDKESPIRGESEKPVSEVVGRPRDKTSPPPTLARQEESKLETSDSPTPAEKEKPFFSRKSPSRDKTSPPRAVSSLIESVSASMTMQKSREMTKAEKYEADILSRPSVFCKRRQEEKEKSQSETKAKETTNQTTSSVEKTSTLPQNKKVSSSSRKNSEELRKSRSPEPSQLTGITTTGMKTSRKTCSDEMQQGNKSNSFPRKESSEEVKDIKTPTLTSTPMTRVTTSRNYSRKGSSKELEVVDKRKSTMVDSSAGGRSDSAELGEKIEKIEMVSKIPTSQTQSQSQKGGGGSTKDDQKFEDDKHSSDMEINFNQEQQSQSTFSSPTLKHPNSIKTSQQHPAPPLTEITASGQKKAKSSSDRGAVKSETTNISKSNTVGTGLSESSTAIKTYSKSTNRSNANTTTASSSLRPVPAQGTESVTSSYGVGPTDDDGTPLFGLRALRKIKQAQEQFATSEKAGVAAVVGANDEYRNMKQNLRSNENFGLRALKKKTGPEAEEESSVPMGSTRESKSEFLSTISTELQQSSSSTSSTMDSEQRSNDTAFNAGSSPKKSILKKTSSFTSQIGTSGGEGSGVIKSKLEDGDEDSNNSDEIESGTTTTTTITTKRVTGGEQTTSEGFTRASSTKMDNRTAVTAAHSNLGGVEDSSWRRLSATPSPDPIVSTSSTGSGGLLSRGKVGRSSVKEMSKRFESTETGCGEGETLLNDQNLNEDGTTRHKPMSFMRESSPSRIPSPVKLSNNNTTTTTTITTTTKSSVEVTGGSGGSKDDNIKIELNRGNVGESSDQNSEEVSYYSPSDSDGGGSGIIRITRTVTVGGTGRSFLNDSSPIQNISDVIERMKGEDGQRKYAEDFKEGETSSEQGGESKNQGTTSEDGLSLLNKFIGAQIIMQSVEPMLLSKKVTMSSSSLIVNGINVDVETDSAKLRQLLVEVDGGDRERIENRLRNLAESSGSTPVERSSSSSFTPRPRPLTKTLSIGGVTLGGGSTDEGGDVTGELMPLILGQLQSSLDNFGASAYGGGSSSSVLTSGNSHPEHHNISTDNSNNTCTNTYPNALQHATDTNKNISTSSDEASSSNTSKCSGSGGGPDSGEDCLFDSGTESGEDVAPPSLPPTTSGNANDVQLQSHHAKSESSPAEFSNFMEGLRNTLKRNQNKDSLLLRSLSHFDALGAFASSSTGGGVTPVSASDSAIADKVLSQRESDALKGACGGGASNLGETSTSGNKSSLKKDPSSVTGTEADRTLIQQVDKVLSLLRDSLVKDPTVLKSLGCSELELNPGSGKGKELIALIDRLKSSLSVSTEICDGSIGNSIKEKRKSAPTLPTLISTCEQEEKVGGLDQQTGNSTAAERAQEMLAWAQIRPPDTVPLPWVNHMQPPERKSSIPGGDGVATGEEGLGAGNENDHYARKGRGVRRRSHTRSHTVGVTQEELAEARRYLQESAYRSALEEKKKNQAKDEEHPILDGATIMRRNSDAMLPVNKSSSRDSMKLGGTVKDSSPEFGRQHSWTQDVEKGLSNMPRPFVKPGLFDSGYVPPPERRMTCAAILDDSVTPLFGNRDKDHNEPSKVGSGTSQFAKLKPFRTFSLDNAYDPSKSFFTKEETQIHAIHQAAIKKQMSEEEDRRARRNSLSSNQNIYGRGGTSGSSSTTRDFSLALPKPYTSPQHQKQQQQHKKMQSSGRSNGSLLNSSFHASSDANDDNRRGSSDGNSAEHNQNQSGGDSGFTEESGSDNRQLRNDQLVLYESSQMSPISLSRSSSTPRSGFPTTTTSSNNNNSTTSGNGNQRIENVQISLKELSSCSEFPQLQIAITLNTNTGNNGSGNNSGGGVALSNNSITSNNTNIGSGNNDPNIQSQSHFLSGRNLSNNSLVGNVTSLTQNPNDNQMEETLSSTSSSKANRYKRKKDRKNRLKRANTIDIPQALGHHDDTSEMEDEEDSDMTEVDHASIKSGHFTYAPFKPKTDGDRKFLAFLEKNSAVSDPQPSRPSHLGVNDKFWNNRFFNLKSNFESSSQGSSPSPSPIMSPNRHAPRSVSEMALTHETIPPSAGSGSDSFSRPVWASRDRGQLPQQVKTKLQVFESKNVEAQSKDIPWRSSAPHIGQNQQQHTQYQPVSGGLNKCFSPQPSQPQGPTAPSVAKRFVASSSVYSTNNVPLSPQQTGFNKPNFGLQRPVATSQPIPRTTPQPEQQQVVTTHPAEGVHMVHATASALEAMKRSGFGPTAVVLPNVASRKAVQSPLQHHHSQITSPIPSNRVIGQEKIELPWAKKEPLSPSELPASRDLKAGRILMSKAKFEQFNQPEITPMHPPLTHGGSSTATPPPIPPKSANAKAFGAALSQSGAGKTTSLPPSKFPTQGSNVNYGQFPPAVGPKPKFGTFGVTQSFDEASKKKMEAEIPKSKFIVPPKSLEQQNIVKQNPAPQSEYQRVPGSAFARKVPTSTTTPTPEPQSRRKSSGQKEEETPSRKSSVDKVDGVQIQTPVVARVMGAAQQQHAAIGGNKMTSIKNEEQVSRLTNARSNIRNILNQFSQSQQSANEDSSDNNCSPPILKANLQLSSLHNPLTKSLSGNALLSIQGSGGGAGGYRPTSLLVGQEELSLHSAHSPSLRPYNSPNNSLASPLSPYPATNSSSVSPAPITVTAGLKTLTGTSITSPVHHYQPQPLPQLQPQRHDQERSSKTRSSIQPSQQQRSLIPKQRSLSEFPKIATPPKHIGVLTIQTDLESLAKAKPSNQQQPVPKAKFQVQQKTQAPPPPVVNRTTPVQKQSSFPQQQQLLQKLEEEQSSPKVLKSYPTTDSLQRTSSGSSIFNRAQSLFLSAQEGMASPSLKNRTKPPSLPKTHGMFPKQFEASMSPDSAKNKQKEVEAYFKQLSQQQSSKVSVKKVSSSSGGSTSSKAHLRKSASHSKILNKQRSLSDGEEDVDQIFESLFKASEEKFSYNRSQISRASAWAQSCSKSLDMSSLMSVVGNQYQGNPTAHEFPLQPPSFYNQNFFGNHFGQSSQQMQTICESKRLINFNQHNDLPAPLMKPQMPPLPLVPNLPKTASVPPPNMGLATPSNSSSLSQIQQNSQILSKQNMTSFKSTSSSTSTSSSSSTTALGAGASSGLNKFKEMDQQAKANSGGAVPMFKLTGASNAKDIILYWCQCRTRDYENVKIDNFSSSWSDGLAFCALIHHFYPDAFDYKTLDPKNRRYNFDLAFRVADEKAGIYPLLDTEDMIVMGRRPDWKCVFTYVQSMYRTLKDL